MPLAQRSPAFRAGQQAQPEADQEQSFRLNTTQKAFGADLSSYSYTELKNDVSSQHTNMETSQANMENSQANKSMQRGASGPVDTTDLIDLQV